MVAIVSFCVVNEATVLYCIEYPIGCLILSWCTLAHVVIKLSTCLVIHHHYGQNILIFKVTTSSVFFWALKRTADINFLSTGYMHKLLLLCFLNIIMY